jgi:predicted AAA+ superfamily ATPase
MKLAHGPSWFQRLIDGADSGEYRSDLRLRDYVKLALRSGFPEAALAGTERGRARWLSSYVDQVITRDASSIAALMSPAPRLHHLRTAEGRNEIDLVIEVGASDLVAIEIKGTNSPDPGDAKHLRWFRRELGERVKATVLLHTGPNTLHFEDGTVAVPIAALWAASPAGSH